MTEIKKTRVFGYVFITFLTSFIFGILFSFWFIGNQNEQDSLTSKKNFLTKDFDFKKFNEVSSIIKDNFYSYDGIKQENLLNGMIRGYVDSLGDQHSEFMDKEEKKQFEEMLSGDFEGIGAVVERHELGVIVDRVINGSPAKKYDLKSGDIIIKVDEKSIEGLSVYDAVAQIKGPALTQVRLTIIRQGEGDLIEKTLMREKIKIPSIESKTFDGNIGYIALNIFGDDTSEEFIKAIVGFKEMKSPGIIIDLRDNGGGYLQSAVEVLSQLVESKKLVVETRFRNMFENQKYYSINGGSIYTGKIVLLVNENSASASEITAGALREYDKAIIVGKKTYGKGSVQEPFDLVDGSLVKLTIAQWYTPKGHMIDKQGITPDIEVSYEKEDYEKKYDRQLEEGKKVLKEFIKIGALQLTIDSFKKK